MNLTYGALKKMVEEALRESNCTAAGGATFKAGNGINYATPKAFKNKKKYE